MMVSKTEVGVDGPAKPLELMDGCGCHGDGANEIVVWAGGWQVAVNQRQGQDRWAIFKYHHVLLQRQTPEG